MVTKKQELIDEAYKLILNNLGQLAADTFVKFYKDKDEESIVSSLEKLISDFIGPEKARQQMANFYHQFNIQK